jgi:hypothetical protein
VSKPIRIDLPNKPRGIALVLSIFNITLLGLFPVSAFAKDAVLRDITIYAQGAIALALVAVLASVLLIPSRMYPSQKKRCARTLILFYIPALLASGVIVSYCAATLIPYVQQLGYASISGYGLGFVLFFLSAVWVLIGVVLDVLLCALFFRLRPQILPVVQ